jgi:hypothetical protein
VCNRVEDEDRHFVCNKGMDRNFVCNNRKE